MLFNFKSALSSSAVFLLVSILSDSFEKNKQDALELLNSLSLDRGSIEVHKIKVFSCNIITVCLRLH